MTSIDCLAGRMAGSRTRDETNVDYWIGYYRHFLADDICTDLEKINQSVNFTISDYIEKHGSDYEFTYFQWFCKQMGHDLKGALSDKQYFMVRYVLSRIVTPIIAASSTVTNCLSMLFFVTNQRKSFVDQLFILLNLLFWVGGK